MSMIAVVNGPNLNLLGEREPDVYGRITWDEVREGLRRLAEDRGVELEFFQSNHEGSIIDYLQSLRGRAQGIIINPGALTHYSYALRDAISSCGTRVVEVHISNVSARESWRAISVISSVVTGTISGLGVEGYRLALVYLMDNMA